MAFGIIGKKVGMSQLFKEDGTLCPVTVVEAGPCVVLQKKTVETDGYSALQLGFDPKKSERVNKPMAGHCAKAGKGSFYHLKEFRIENVSDYEVGQEISVGEFQEGEFVKVAGTTKGKGYQGVVKRHGYQGGRNTHGSRFHRRPGSLGPSTTPSHVLKGVKLPGQCGNVTRTVQNLKVMAVDQANNLIYLKGAVPGPSEGVVFIRKIAKKGK